MNLMVLDIFSL